MQGRAVSDTSIRTVICDDIDGDSGRRTIEPVWMIGHVGSASVFAFRLKTIHQVTSDL
jgi:hypothetical protein